MKAIIFEKYGSPDVIQYMETEKPTPKSGEILVKVHASSATTADSMIREGNPCYGRLFLGLTKHKKPIAGTGFAGEVEAIGKGVSEYEVGDKVFGETGMNFSANAEYLCISEEDVVTKLVHTMSYEEAAPICDGALTSYAFLKDIGNLKRGQSVLINGASGSLGSAAVQIAKHLGANVTGICGSTNIEMVKSLGADTVINYQEVDFTEINRKFNLIYDAVGKSSFSRCKKLLTENGSYLSPVLSFPLLIQMLGTACFGTKKAKFSATGLRPSAELKVLLNELKVMYESNNIKTVIDRRYALAETADAHKYIDTGHKKGNVVITV